MSDSFLTDKLAEVRSELTRLHQKEALLVRAVLAEPEFAARVLQVGIDSMAAGMTHDAGDRVAPTMTPDQRTQTAVVPRSRPGWPMIRATPNSETAARVMAPQKLALVHSAP